MTGQPRATLGLNLNVKPAGSHPAAWRHPAVDLAGINDIDALVDLAKVAERGRFDALFLADKLSFSREPAAVAPAFEPLTLLAALAAATSRIGLIGSVSTTYSDPFVVARQTASLDRISRGRFGWNVVTSGVQAAARNFGQDALPGHGERYRRAEEFVTAVKALWDSWEDDAIVADRGRGWYVDPAKVHAVDHAGDSFRIAGPLNSPRPPQGWPVIVQAGSSDDGRALAARHADSVYTVVSTVEDGRAFRTDLRERAAAEGRDPDAVRVFAGFRVLVAETAAAARALEAELNRLADPRQVLAQVALFSGYDLSRLALDAPLPPVPPVESSDSYRSHLRAVHDFMARERPTTVLEFAQRLGGGLGADNLLVGDAASVADELEAWFRAGAMDGANLQPEVLHQGTHALVDHLVPELERRGLRPPAYEGTTLRQHYGLARPAGQGRVAARA
ncbi:NtaA/DmoA family FMN-dependent monooxygenase [Actinacidiphila yeochonensis]|uniref:NtaA/DmoA family FMN-dependent monooxygenase n=1 Tax=Actinacidiphila yeochonensis TaxID=89050 RepID=UPI000563D4FD|nr:NtaA/DmoA family FMN-dependent monooxygenase [Actinacidiphila yeochonensis]